MDKGHSVSRSNGCGRTSLSANRLMLFASCMIFLVINSVIIAETVNITTEEVLYQFIYTDCQFVGDIIISCACCILATAVLGFIAAYWRLRSMVKVFLVLMMCFLIFNVVCTILLSGYYHPDQLKVQSENFRTGWTEVMGKIVAGQDQDGSLMAFVSDMSTEGQCCGYDSLTSVLQNPPEAKCSSSYTETCDAYLNQYITDSLTHLLTIYSILFALMALMFIGLDVVLVRIVPQPVYSDAPGGYYYA